MDKTIKMAREAVNGRLAKTLEETQSLISLEEVKRFEALVRADEREETNSRANASWTLMCEKMVAAEREECAKVCEDSVEYAGDELARQIRARGQA